MKPEYKFHDDSVSATNLTNAGVWIIPCTDLAQGATASTRIGRRVTAKKVSIRGQVYVPHKETGVVGYNGFCYRVIVGIDKQTNGTATTVNHLLTSGHSDKTLAMYEEHKPVHE